MWFISVFVFIITFFSFGQILELKIDKQAGAELNQAQVNLKVIVEVGVGVEVGGEVEAFHY